ncbi:hypothetical protein ABT124_40950 [Streptomyces sp. NPDC001982]|uniref:DUF7065 domain-containing protein n=1 Tax=unclassified Streptomyces TaxID=2593676 RepID=UPI00332E3ED9
MTSSFGPNAKLGEIDEYGWPAGHKALTPDDDRIHEGSDDPMWNESAWFGFMIPEANLMGGIHFHHRPNMNLLWQKVLLWDGNDGRGEQVYDCVYYDAFEIQPRSLANVESPFDFSSVMGLSPRTIDKWKRYGIRYERNDLVLDLEFEAIMDVFSTPYSGKARGWGINNYQQAGRMRGTIRMDGTELTVDGPAHRDRSWGPRNFNHSSKDFPRHQWPWATDGVGFAANLYTVAETLPAEEQPIVAGAPFKTPEVHFGEERVLNGFLHRDGAVSRVVSGSYDILKRRSDGLPSEVRMQGTDELGRDFSAQGFARNYLKRSSPPGVFATCSLVEWTFDSGEHCWGQLAEVLPQDMSRRFFRNLPPTGGSVSGS